MGSYLVPGGRMCFDISEMFLCVLRVHTDNHQVVLHPPRTFSSQLPVQWSGHWLFSVGSADRKSCFPFLPQESLWLSHQDWDELLLSLERAEWILPAAQERRWWVRAGHTAPVAVRSGTMKKKTHREGQNWHLFCCYSTRNVPLQQPGTTCRLLKPGSWNLSQPGL